MDPYIEWMLLIGLLTLGASWLPDALRKQPISFSLIYLIFGILVFALPLGLASVTKDENGRLIEHISELSVILALTGVGLSIDRKIGFRRWTSTWRLLAITMPLSILFVGYGGMMIGLPLASAALLGAVLAPTDPVLAGDVQTPPPMEGRDDETRFALTSEAGLNDGLAFPFTGLAIALALNERTGEPWLIRWLTFDLLYKIAAGILVGWLIGRLMVLLSFRVKRIPSLASSGKGLAALAITLISYSAAESVNGYGFLAVFVTAVTLRRGEPEDGYHGKLHNATHQLELLFMSIILVMIGGEIADGALTALTWPAVLLAVAFVFIIRPLLGYVSLLKSPLVSRERAAVSFFGIRGIGSIYYFAYAINKQEFANEDLVWAIVLLVIAISVTVHGISASPVMRWVDKAYPQKE